jgi:glycerophosphoryl diester phosphodiesterase
MNAESVNLWYRIVTQQFIDKAHHRELAVLVVTANGHDELLEFADIGVDGIFTAYYSEAVRVLNNYMKSMP